MCDVAAAISRKDGTRPTASELQTADGAMGANPAAGVSGGRRGEVRTSMKSMSMWHPTTATLHCDISASASAIPSWKAGCFKEKEPAPPLSARMDPTAFRTISSGSNPSMASCASAKQCVCLQAHTPCEDHSAPSAAGRWGRVWTVYVSTRRSSSWGRLPRHLRTPFSFSCAHRTTLAPGSLGINRGRGATGGVQLDGMVDRRLQPNGALLTLELWVREAVASSALCCLAGAPRVSEPGGFGKASAFKPAPPGDVITCEYHTMLTFNCGNSWLGVCTPVAAEMIQGPDKKAYRKLTRTIAHRQIAIERLGLTCFPNQRTVLWYRLSHQACLSIAPVGAVRAARSGFVERLVCP